ncbi:uncharacterized protein ACIB01_002989 [Guaruba guarouba]
MRTGTGETEGLIGWDRGSGSAVAAPRAGRRSSRLPGNRNRNLGRGRPGPPPSARSGRCHLRPPRLREFPAAPGRERLALPACGRTEQLLACRGLLQNAVKLSSVVNTGSRNMTTLGIILRRF